MDRTASAGIEREGGGAETETDRRRLRGSTVKLV